MLAKTWPIWEKMNGEPFWLVMQPANSSIRVWIARDSALNFAARSAGVVRDHSPSKAVRAAATARSMSAVVPSGTRAMTCSVWGLMTSIVPVPAGETNSPPM